MCGELFLKILACLSQTLGEQDSQPAVVSACQGLAKVASWPGEQDGPWQDRVSLHPVSW